MISLLKATCQLRPAVSPGVLPVAPSGRAHPNGDGYHLSLARTCDTSAADSGPRRSFTRFVLAAVRPCCELGISDFRRDARTVDPRRGNGAAEEMKDLFGGWTMRVAVVGATGRIGRHTVRALERSGNEAVPISRSLGVDAYTGSGLEEALQSVNAVVDVSNTSSQDEAEIVDFFGITTANLLVTEQRTGVDHHVLLSIVGLERGQQVPHYVGKREQERLVTSGSIPWSVVRATQFHDFAAQVASWTLRDGTATIAPLLVQPIAHSDVGNVLADVATQEPLRHHLDVAGPETQDLVDMARRTFEARAEKVHLVPTWRGIFDTSMAGEVLLPGESVQLGHITFDDWIASGADS